MFSDRADWDGLCAELAEIPWAKDMLSQNVQEKYNYILSTVYNIASKHIPQCTLKTSKRSNIPKDRKILMRKKSKLKKKLASCVNTNNINAIQA